MAALAVIELTARQIMDPGRTQLHRDELAVILRDLHPVMVALEVATILAGVVTASWLPLGQLIQAKRARLPAYLTGTDATATVLRLRKTRTVQTMVIDPRSPGATLIKPLTDAEVTVTQPSTATSQSPTAPSSTSSPPADYATPDSRGWMRPPGTARSAPRSPVED